MGGSQLDKHKAIKLPLDLLLIFSGRVAIAAGDNLVAAIDGVNSARSSLYHNNRSYHSNRSYLNHHNRDFLNRCSNNYLDNKEDPSLRVAKVGLISQAVIIGIGVAIRNVCRYHLESNRKMNEELRLVFEDYILGRGKD